jgi:hypothetical protein
MASRFSSRQGFRKKVHVRIAQRKAAGHGISSLAALWLLELEPDFGLRNWSQGSFSRKGRDCN